MSQYQSGGEYTGVTNRLIVIIISWSIIAGLFIAGVVYGTLKLGDYRNGLPAQQGEIKAAFLCEGDGCLVYQKTLSSKLALVGSTPSRAELALAIKSAQFEQTVAIKK